MRICLAIALLLGGLAVAPATASPARPDQAQTAFDQAIDRATAAMQVDARTSLRNAVEAETLAGAIVDARSRGIARAKAEWLQSEGLLRVNRTADADRVIASALAVVDRIDRNSTLHGNLLLSRGGLQASRGHVYLALRDYQRAYEMFQINGDRRDRAKTLVIIAALYGDANDAEAALKYLGQSLDVYTGDPNLVLAIYNNRATYLQDMERYAEAQAQYKKALEIAERTHNPAMTARILGNIALASLKAGDVGKATSTINAAMTLAHGRGSAAAARAQLLPIAAKVALRHGDTTRAAALIGERFAGVDTTTTTVSFRESHDAAYAVFTALHQPDRALAHLAALKRLDDQATKLATSTNTALMAARFDFANQELKISQLRQDELQRTVAFEQARAHTQRSVFIGSAAAVAIIIGILTFALVTLRRSRDSVRAANDDLAVTNGALGKALAAKTEFLATTSHEIRTPLNGILGMTQVMLADAKLAPDVRDRLGVVHGAGVTMRALVDDILDVAKMETGNLTIEHAPFDLCASVTDATRLWDEQARAKGLTFDVDLAGCPVMIMGDAARMRQIVFNLLSNALKFTQAGRVALSVRTDGDRLRIAVADSGIGIPSEKLEEIFESFRQADAGTTRQFGGTGLGLSICRNLARAMGGDVTVTSVVGEGATFTLALPLTRAAAVETAQGASDGTAATLIVDRNPITRSMFKTLLAPHSEAVILATGADEAVTRLAQGGIRHVLIDDATVRADGEPLRALADIAAAAGDATTTLLWPISAQAEQDDLMRTGITRVVARPVSGAALVAAIFAKPVANNHVIPDLVSQAA